MLERIIQYSIHHKLIVLLFSGGMVAFGLYALLNIPIGAVPDVTNNQVQIITTSRNLATEDVEKFLTYPVELEMANLPEVKEIRSISKFGLSVVTVVFNDNIDTYLPRQLIAEKIKNAEVREIAHFDVRIGIHTGPVVAGVVGTKKFAYDIWGDTVNIASRLESNSQPGKINVSENPYKLIKDSFDCEYRGEIEAKNKGMMKMYYVHKKKGDSKHISKSNNKEFPSNNTSQERAS